MDLENPVGQFTVGDGLAVQVAETGNIPVGIDGGGSVRRLQPFASLSPACGPLGLRTQLAKRLDQPKSFHPLGIIESALHGTTKQQVVKQFEEATESSRQSVGLDATTAGL